MDKTVLVVEDEPSLREMISIILQDEGFTTYEAENGERAVALLDEHVVDLVLSDISMPKMDGLELGLYCKEHFPELPFVLMSGGSRELQNIDEEGYLESGKEITQARFVLQKPFDLDAFMKVINECLP